MGVGKKVLGLVSLLLMLALWASYFYVFKENRDGQLGGAFDSTAWCGTHRPAMPRYWARIN